jgi:hypothetical protein
MKRVLSRRAQILQGIATSPDGAKGAAHERRREPRQLPPIGMGRLLIGERPSLAVNVSRSGLAARTTLSLGIGDSVPVKFAGFPVKGARIVWIMDGHVGLAATYPFEAARICNL